MFPFGRNEHPYVMFMGGGGGAGGAGGGGTDGHGKERPAMWVVSVR
jgi:hypothetical protein